MRWFVAATMLCVLFLASPAHARSAADRPDSFYTAQGYVAGEAARFDRAQRFRSKAEYRSWRRANRATRHARVGGREFRDVQRVVGTGGPVLLEQARSTIGATARQLGVPSSLWCADAVNLWLRRAGFPTISSRWARAFVSYGRSAGGPAPGVIAVFPRGKNPRNGHVGVVASVRGDTMQIISGNCGRTVCVSPYPVRRAIAFRWPPGA